MKKLIIAAMLLVVNIVSLNMINAVAEKTISPNAKVAFDQIQKIWNSHEKTISDFDKNIINNRMNNTMETVDKVLKNVNTQILFTEILNVIKTIKDQGTFKPVSTKLSAGASQALKNIFDATKDFYQKLVETQKIVVNAKVEPELIGNTTSFDKLAQGLLVMIKDAIANHNMNPSLLPLKITDEEYRQSEKAFEELRNPKLYEVVIKK